MKLIENRVRRAVEAGEIIDYAVIPIYRGDDPVPVGITIRASGDEGFDLTVTLLNEPDLARLTPGPLGL